MNPIISVVIVTYHTSPITHLCLWSLACSGLKYSEVIIVDNAGNDPYIHEIQSDFPFIKIIQNTTNEGFGKACNRGFENSKGDIILFLNPDTIVPEDFEEKIIDFFKSHPNAGTMGPKIIDGSGHFQQESKRNFPRPLAALLKISKLARFIPASAIKYHYYAQHINPNTLARTEILSGSFMAVTRDAMNQTGGFDPRYFLHAEDIDFSWTIGQAGFEVWYNPNIIIVHLKGETIKKDPSYIRYFYRSMLQFYDKYYSAKQNPLIFFIGETSIKLLSFISAIWHRYRIIFGDTMPSTITLHPLSCMETFTTVQPALPFQVKKATGPRAKTNSFLLTNSRHLTPRKLISILLENQIEGSPKLMLWHETARHLLLLYDAHHNCLSIPISKIK
ncbi:MAG: glycosyltransferase family 2 protein [Bacteroidota bacterium]